VSKEAFAIADPGPEPPINSWTVRQTDRDEVRAEHVLDVLVFGVETQG